MRGFSPASLILLCWSVTLVCAVWTLSRLERLELVALFMQRESLALDAFTMMGVAWIALSLLLYCTGDLATSALLPDPSAFVFKPEPERAAFWVFTLNLALLSVTGLWILLSAAQLGGLRNLANLAYLDSLGARDVLLSNKLFTGMRLFYAALPATGCVAAAILASGRHNISGRALFLCSFTLIINTIALFVLPLVMSQRLLLLQFLLSAYLVTCLVRKEIVGIGWLTGAAFVFLSAWILRESITNPLVEGSALSIGIQKLAFYFVNDLWNGFAPLQAEIAHTFGGVSLRGLMFLTFTDDFFSNLLQTRTEQLDAVLGGGDFPFFTAAYVDFGPLFGALFIVSCACLFRLVFHMALQSFTWACLYAQLGAALLFSTHGIYFTHQNFLFSLGVIGLIRFLAREYSPRFHSYRGKQADA